MTKPKPPETATVLRRDAENLLEIIRIQHDALIEILKSGTRMANSKVSPALVANRALRECEKLK